MKEAMSSHIKVQKSDIGKGDTVLLHIPSADRGKMDRKHIPCKINGFYKLGCALGQLKINYGITDFNPIEKSMYFPELDVIPDKVVSL